MAKKLRKRKKIETFDIVNVCVLTLLMLIVLIPFYLTIIQSFMTQQEYIMNSSTLWPKEPTLGNYRDIFVGSTMVRSFGNSVFYTVVGVIFSMFITTTLAYGLAKKGYPGRAFFQNMVIFTMYFSGGLIPFFLLVKQLGLINTRWAIIIPSACSIFNMIILRNFFEQLPPDLDEAATLDGAGRCASSGRSTCRSLSRRSRRLCCFTRSAAGTSGSTRACSSVTPSCGRCSSSCGRSSGPPPALWTISRRRPADRRFPRA